MPFIEHEELPANQRCNSKDEEFWFSTPSILDRKRAEKDKKDREEDWYFVRGIEPWLPQNPSSWQYV